MITPRLIRTNGLGTGSQARWRTARPRACANSRERTGSGPDGIDETTFETLRTAWRQDFTRWLEDRDRLMR